MTKKKESIKIMANGTHHTTHTAAARASRVLCLLVVASGEENMARNVVVIRASNIK